MEKGRLITFWRCIPIELTVALCIALAALLANFILYGQGLAWQEGIIWIVRYFGFGNNYFLWFALLVYGIFLKEFYVSATRLLQRRIINGHPIVQGDIMHVASYLWQPFLVLLPLSMVAGPLSSLLSSMSYEFRDTTMDITFLYIDQLLMGASPFIALPDLIKSDGAVWLLYQSYISLSLGISIALAILYFVSRQHLFRVAVLAFILSLAFAYPFFYAFPCQAPSNFFVLNARDRSFSPELQTITDSYHASPLTLSIIKSISNAQTNTQKDNTVPISCFPSLHATWVFFIMYFLFLVRPWSLFVSLPWAIVVLTGGLYFAQHYFVDYIVALPITAATLVSAHLLLKKEQHWQIKKPFNKRV